jgi:hypothetical protein
MKPAVLSLLYMLGHTLLPIYDLRQIVKNDKPAMNGHLWVHKDSLIVELSSAPFRPKQHVLRKDNSGYIQKIDGKRPLGTDGDMPLEKMTALRVTIGGRAVDIPAAPPEATKWPGLLKTASI